MMHVLPARPFISQFYGNVTCQRSAASPCPVKTPATVSTTPVSHLSSAPQRLSAGQPERRNLAAELRLPFWQRVVVRLWRAVRHVLPAVRHLPPGCPAVAAVRRSGGHPPSVRGRCPSWDTVSAQLGRQQYRYTGSVEDSRTYNRRYPGLFGDIM